ncbi:hypothetical protein BHM03_00020723 [Ensete ventricosum]|nr:hypothetical protein BHM03_00020723 [Ensete ventricosum]
MYFGVACSFLALRLMSRTRELRLEHVRWSIVGEMMLKGSAQLLGLLVERAQRKGEALEAKLREAGSEVAELKRRRTEDAKANEKVVSIFAAREQSWIAERKSLRHQIQAQLGEMCVLRSSNDEAVSNLRKRLGEEERLVGTMKESLEEEAKRRKALEMNLKLAEQAAGELSERLMKEAQAYSEELWKHKATLMELLSNQCRMESEMGHALGQVEVAKEQLKGAIQQKEEADAMVEKLSGDVAKIQKDCEQKDKILSAMLRKSKLDTAERQMLLREVKALRAKQKQAEVEMERWTKTWESKHKRSSRALRSMEAGCSQERRARLQLESRLHNPKILLMEYLEAASRRDHSSSTSKSLDLYSSDKNDETGTISILLIHHSMICFSELDSFASESLEDEFQQLQDWVRTGTEKYAAILEQRHRAEMEAFTEQMRQTDEKLEALQRQMLSKELETKMLQSHIEGVDGNLSHLREENIRLGAMLLDKEKEARLLKEQLSFLLQQYQKSNLHCSPSPEAGRQKIKERKPREKKDSKAHKSDTKTPEKNSLMQSESSKDCGINTTTNSTSSPSQTSHVQEHDRRCTDKLPAEQPERVEESPLQDQTEIKEAKDVGVDPGSANEANSFQGDAAISGKLSSTKPSIAKEEPSWKTDIHALGVSYNIRRLKQQLLVLEKLAGLLASKQLTPMDALSVGSSDRKIDENKQKMKGFSLMKSLLNKQVKIYQSLEEKTDDLCRRMHGTYSSGSRRDSQGSRTWEQTETLKCHLEETFELQKYVVATGQRFMEMQAKINSSFSGSDAHDKSIGFNLRQFADIIRTIFRQVQKGLEVRVARIIGELEGKLTCDSILRRC